MMEAPERVVWSEGMLMTPQHLQQQDLYHERLLSYRLEALSPHFFGVLHLELDTNALSAGQVHVLKFAGVLPSGTAVALTAGQKTAQSTRVFTAAFAPTQRTLSIYLGVPREREGVANVSLSSNAETTEISRATTVSRTVADLVSDKTAAVEIAFARLQPQILFENEASNDVDALKIAEIVRTDAGGYAVSEAYIPPLLHIGASPHLMAELRHLVGLATARQRSLAEMTKERAASALEFRASDITTFLQMSAVNAMLPVVQYLSETPHAPPLQAYLSLAQLAGQLMTFTAQRDPTQLPRFAYADLAGTFRGLFEIIGEFLGQAVMKPYERLGLTLYRNGVMAAELESEKLRRCKTFVLVARVTAGDLDRERLAIEVPKLAKIGSKATIKSIIQAASNGVPLTLTHRPPPEVPVRQGATYFMLQTHDPAWKGVESEGNVAIFVPPPFGAPAVEYDLLAVPEGR